jgi:5'-3' exonuclease
MFSTYKANRQKAPDWYTNRKPIIVDYLFKKWNFVYTQKSYETDDVCTSVAYSLTKEGYTPIISSVDKDLRQSSGWNYNPKSGELVLISPEEAERNMLTQLLTGDSTDNIKGVPGIGPAKAKKIVELENMDGQSAYERVVETYYNYHLNLAKGLVDFAENVLQVVMRRDSDYPFILLDVPEQIRKYNPEELFK